MFLGNEFRYILVDEASGLGDICREVAGLVDISTGYCDVVLGDKSTTLPGNPPPADFCVRHVPALSLLCVRCGCEFVL